MSFRETQTFSLDNTQYPISKSIGCFFQGVCRSWLLLLSSATSLLQATKTSPLSYCNSILIGFPDSTLTPLTPVLSTSSRIIILKQAAYIILLLSDFQRLPDLLQWRPVPLLVYLPCAFWPPLLSLNSSPRMLLLSHFIPATLCSNIHEFPAFRSLSLECFPQMSTLFFFFFSSPKFLTKCHLLSETFLISI